VGISSRIGEGSIFDIHLPASPGNQPAAVEVKEVAELRGVGRILIMDDEDFIREIATEILQYMGYDVESCADGGEAVECFQKAREIDNPFACVILDLTVPGGLGGRETAARLLGIDPDAVLIVSSGYSNDPIISNFKKYGFKGAIRKPFDADTLASELAKLIQRPFQINHEKFR
jgi:CheY-like chemotaxis protein